MIAEAIAAHLGTVSSGFTIGSLGAIAEFFRDPHELVDGAGGALWAASPRGAIRVELREGVLPLAHESLSARAGVWQHGVLFCLPEDVGSSACRVVVTELGPDSGAVRAQDRNGILFDLGLGQRNVDFCVRTSDPGLIATLRKLEGGSAGPLLGSLIDASPHRVALSALGRIEVYLSTDGPRTQVLSLLKTGRTHSANIPVPRGYLPCLALYPQAGAAFQSLMERWGDTEFVAEKRRAMAAMESGATPDVYAPPSTRIGRTALRVAIRQRARLADVAAWSERFD